MTVLSRKVPKRAYVYVICCGDFSKVGIAQHVKRRLGGISCGNPYPVWVARHFLVPWENAPAIEREAHKRLDDWHHKGEWFTCSWKRAAAAVEAAIDEVRANPLGHRIRLPATAASQKEELAAIREVMRRRFAHLRAAGVPGRRLSARLAWHHGREPGRS